MARHLLQMEVTTRLSRSLQAVGPLPLVTITGQTLSSPSGLVNQTVSYLLTMQASSRCIPDPCRLRNSDDHRTDIGAMIALPLVYTAFEDLRTWGRGIVAKVRQPA